ncbi:hypothetical protein JXB22_03925 [candidate division WOR-3 bacterium]|nr:hypothetical protein [candidate division WOR-3 bacterium]
MQYVITANDDYMVIVFQSTPLREGRQYILGRFLQEKLFQSTPLREGRLSTGGQARHGVKFQSTPLREGRPFS